MMLLNKLYKIKSVTQTGNTIDAAIELDQTHPVFQGHFPGNPIVPGVFLIQIVKEILSERMNSRLRLTESDNVKFLAVLNPVTDKTVNVNITFERDNDLLKTKAKIYNENKVYLSFKGVFV
jgi:3-hydroxyacyl-[acyl-carrier-protein] dehydratase